MNQYVHMSAQNATLFLHPDVGRVVTKSTQRVFYQLEQTTRRFNRISNPSEIPIDSDVVCGKQTQMEGVVKSSDDILDLVA
jgi:hypothetical protein